MGRTLLQSSEAPTVPATLPIKSRTKNLKWRKIESLFCFLLNLAKRNFDHLNLIIITLLSFRDSSEPNGESVLREIFATCLLKIQRKNSHRKLETIES